ncbi:MAG TPA: L-seryl-tRNA(Sec) selenium transferase [Chloroflexia bacterium]|nr:L-seryl-tRNA(Sec) selenium transferase [Chloroflexia bacterium]
MVKHDPAVPSDRRRTLPSVDQLVSAPALAAARATLPHALVVDTARDTLAAARAAVAAGRPVPPLAALAATLRDGLHAATTASLQPVINAGGVIIQTNLGRAPLSLAARDAMLAAAAYSNLEYDLDAGVRSVRYRHAARLLTRLTGAEDALVVNNAAAALYLVLLALAAGREVVLSRGQAVEIGGGFRIPDILRQSGATLVEVGTTNRTYLRDYEAALTAQTAGLLRVHTSNFRVVGFTHTVAVAELAALAHRQNLWLVDDTGSGALLPTAAYGLAPEPLVPESVAAGADLVLFSGDKLLGGPQAGIIVGRRALVGQLRQHPLARALRVDKITYAGLEATLLQYVRGEAERAVPVWAMIGADLAGLEGRARAWAATLAAAGLPVAVVPGRSAVGGGTLPGETLPTWLLALGPAADGAGPPLAAPELDDDEDPPGRGGVSAAALARRLRQGRPAVVARVDHDRVLCDPRTVPPEQDAALLAALQAAWPAAPA